MELSKVEQPDTYKLAGKRISFVINPDKAVKADVLLFDQPQDKFQDSDDQKVFDGAGEYEVNDTMLDGIAINGSISYGIDLEGMRVVYLGSGVVELSDKQIEVLSPVDTLLLPCSELLPEQIAKLISQLEPRIVVPVGANESTLQKISAELGVTPEKTAKLKIATKDLPQDNQKLVVVE